MTILIFGDIVGRAGRGALAEFCRTFRASTPVDFIIANGENLSHGRGLTPDTINELFAAGVSVITNGNHAWDTKQALQIVQREPRVLRPLNFPPGMPGQGSIAVPVGIATVVVANVLGRVFFREHYDDPFRALEEWLATLPRVQPLITLVDVHAEATSEKRALGLFLDGRVTAVWGTHTHIPTADEQLLPKGTAYLTDVGMTGAQHSLLGFEAAPLLERFRTQLPAPFHPAEERPWEVNALLLDIDERTGRARTIERLRHILP